MTTDHDPSGTYAGRRVLVTGHTGFKGSWLCAWLHELGADVIGLSDATRAQGSYHDFALDKLVDGHVGDVADANTAARAMVASRPDLVFHLAAQPLVRRSWRDPLGTIAANVLGTANVVDAALQQSSVRGVVVATTDKVYENLNERRRFMEGDQLGGHDPYSASKAAAELILVPYRDAELMGHAARPIVSVRAGNVIGGGDWSEDRLLPDIVRALREGRSVELRRPDAVRPWQHVLDCLWGYLLTGARILEGDEPGDAFNFAHSDGARSVLELTERAYAAWGADPAGIRIERDESTAEAEYLQLDASRAGAELGWHAKWTVDHSVDEAIRYYQADDPGAVGRNQIVAHMEDRYLT